MSSTSEKDAWPDDGGRNRIPPADVIRDCIVAVSIDSSNATTSSVQRLLVHTDRSLFL